MKKKTNSKLIRKKYEKYPMENGHYWEAKFGFEYKDQFHALYEITCEKPKKEWNCHINLIKSECSQFKFTGKTLENVKAQADTFLKNVFPGVYLQQ